MPSLKSLIPARRPMVLSAGGGHQPAAGRDYHAWRRSVPRLYYMDSELSNPFAPNMTAWLRKGYLDLKGQTVTKDQFVPDNVVLEFKDGKELIVHSRNLPNDPTAQFLASYGNSNPNSIPEMDRKFLSTSPSKQRA